MIFIKNYENKYSVTKNGKVFSHISNMYLKPIKQNTGYLSVTLYKNKKAKMFSIHRLVCEAYILNINNYRCVNHKNRNRWDNRLENLEWCSHKYNSIHSFKHGREAWNKGKKSKGISNSKKGYKNPMAVKLLDTNTNKIYQTITEASEDLSIPIGTIVSRLNRESKLNNFRRL